MELVETRIVVEDGEVVETRLRAGSVGVFEGKIIRHFQILAVPFKRMAWIDGEELAVDEPFVLSALADAVAVRRQQEERLVFAKRFWFRAFRAVWILPRNSSAVLKHSVLHILVAVGELGRKHDFGMAVGIFSTHDFELLRGHAGQPCQIVCECFGDSSGGNFAAAVCLLARDRKGKAPCYQMLIYPVVDAKRSFPSATSCLDTPELNSYGLDYAWRLYLQNGDQGMLPYASPYLAEDLSGLPPAYVETAEFDPLHDEGLAYAKKLEAAGVPVELNETKGSYHGFDIQMELPYSKAALNHRIQVLKKAFRIKD